MTPSHAAKKGKRYRYYVSQSLIGKRSGEVSGGRRLPAGEIERLVGDRLCQFLRNDTSVIDALKKQVSNVTRQQQILQKLQCLCDAWPTLEPTVVRSIYLHCIVRIDVLPTQVILLVRKSALSHIGTEMDMKTLTMEEGDVITLSIDARLRRTGLETKMVLEGNSDTGTRRKPSRSLVRLLVRARSFHDYVKKNADKSIRQLSVELDTNESYIARMMRLAYLAPDIVQGILHGNQPPELTARKLQAASKLPLTWDEQRKALGFA